MKGQDLSLPGKHKSLEQNCLSTVFFFFNTETIKTEYEGKMI